VDQLVAAKEFEEAISLLSLMVDRGEANSVGGGGHWMVWY
jgi:pentatricopeptide repeat protein